MNCVMPASTAAKRRPTTSQMPTMTRVVFKNMKVKPPTYLLTSSQVRRIGLASSKSMVPLRSMLGMKKAVMIELSNIVMPAPIPQTR